ncbi:MAG TPA: DUF480 domain-containing protein [Solirubrobacteraceae bacterium]|nr:DUF480 domain-containing protein [Solirubrobacteraceae bacterium]
MSVDTDLEPCEVRVLGCLLEKQRLTPDGYPLTLNSLRAACNQATSRDPVVDYDEATVRAALARLTRRGYARLASGPGSRAPKYRHLLSDVIELSPGEQALLALLLLRGEQTPGELRARSERLHAFPDFVTLQRTLEEMVERGLVERHPRRPGQKEDRYAHRLSESALPQPGDAAAGAPAPPVTSPVSTGDPAPAGAHHRIERLEGAIQALRGEVTRLRGELDRLRGELGESDGAQTPPSGEEGVD